MADGGLVTECLGNRQRGLEAIECRVQVQLDAVRDADPAEQRRGDRRLLRRPQLRQRLLIQLAGLLRPSLSLGQLRTIDEGRRRRGGAEQPRLKRMLERVRQRLRRVAHADDGTSAAGRVVMCATLGTGAGGGRSCRAFDLRRPAGGKGHRASRGFSPVWPDGYCLLGSVHPTAMI